MVSRAEAIPARVHPAASTAVHATRRAVAALLVAAGALVMYGIAWDATWHSSVGRDQGFLSPPHALMYGSAAAGGLVCIAAVLIETARYHRRSGVDDGNSVRLFRLFHAPIGLLVAGFGILVIVVAGPLDNYWHSMYGIFIDAWNPFHLMGEFGGAIWGLGNLYLWAALLLRARRRQARDAIEWWGFLAAAAVMMRLMMLLASPALHVVQTLPLGSLRIMTYPVVLSLSTIWLLTAVGAMGRRWTGPIVVALLLGFHLIVQLTVPGIVRAQAAAEGRTFFHPTLIPTFSLDRLAPDVGLLIGTVLLAVLSRRSGAPARSSGAAVSAALMASGGFWLIGLVTTVLAQQVLTRLVLPPALPMTPLATWRDGLAALPLTVAAAGMSGWMGRGIGRVLARNPR